MWASFKFWPMINIFRILQANKSLIMACLQNHWYYQNFAEIIQTQWSYLTSLDKKSILTWRLLVISSQNLSCELSSLLISLTFSYLGKYLQWMHLFFMKLFRKINRKIWHKSATVNRFYFVFDSFFSLLIFLKNFFQIFINWNRKRYAFFLPNYWKHYFQNCLPNFK